MSRDDWRSLIDVDVIEACAGAVTRFIRTGASGRLVFSF